MTTRVVDALKYFGLFSLVFFTLISCEKEIESIGVNLVDSNNFSTNKFISEVITTNINIERVPTNGAQQYLLGVYSDKEFGKLKASIVTQLSLPLITDEYTYGTNAKIDSVIMSIPYQSTAEDDYSDGKPKFSIDSVFGNTDTEFQLNVYELKTFLNTLDPEDPTKNAVYYSDKVFEKGETPFYSGNFKINPDDTVSYINRYLADGITVFDKDTIKEDSKKPLIKLPLDEDMIKQIFVDNANDAGFDSYNDFIHYFRGFYIEAKELTTDNSHLISLDMSNSKMTIYYSNDEDEAAEEDLNENGINGEQGIRIKHDYEFSFGSLKTNVIERDYTVSHESGEERLYLQGAAGSMATVEMFSNEDLAELQNKNWLINEANLSFYVDQNASSDILPEQLYVYNYSDNEQILDILSSGGSLSSIGGTLERDDDGNPYRYVIKITDYISELLKSDEPLDLVKLGIKVYNPEDLPTDYTDIKVPEYSWTPKGVVLFDNNTNTGDKRVKLEIFYTELNN